MVNKKQKILVIFFTVLIALAMVFSIEINSAEASGKLKTPVIKTIKNVDNLEIKLTWGKVTGAQKYYIYRATSKNGTYRRIASVSKSKTSYTDATIKNRTTYYYKVKAIASTTRNNSSLSTYKSKRVNFTGEIFWDPSGQEQTLQKGQVWSVYFELYDFENEDNYYRYSALDFDIVPAVDVSDFLEIRLLDSVCPQFGNYMLEVKVKDIPRYKYVDLYFYIKGHKNLYKEKYRIYFDSNTGAAYLLWPNVPDFGSLAGVAPCYVEYVDDTNQVFVYDKTEICEALADMNFDTMEHLRANGGQCIYNWWKYVLEQNGFNYIMTENIDGIPTYYFGQHFPGGSLGDYDIYVAIGFDSKKNDDYILVQILFRE